MVMIKLFKRTASLVSFMKDWRLTLLVSGNNFYVVSV